MARASVPVPGAPSGTEPLLGHLSADKPIPHGTFWVKQTHLGFCPAKVMLQIRPMSVALLDDNHLVIEYQYQNLVLWTQNKTRITLLLQSNLKRLVLTAKNREAARRISVALHDATQALQHELARRKAVWGWDSADEDASASEDTVRAQGSMFDSEDRENVSLGSARVFKVGQTHMSEHSAHMLMRVDKNGVCLVAGDTGRPAWSCDWSKILMWKADDAAIVLVLNQSNRQVELMTPKSKEISTALTAMAHAVQVSMQTQHYARREQVPQSTVEFRRQMLSFEAPVVTPNAKWKEANGKAGFRQLFSLKPQQNIVESMQAREQLQAVFDIADTDGSGSLDVGEVAELMRDLQIFDEDGTEFSRADIELMLVDMDAFGNEVTFDGFVSWALNSTSGAMATTMLRNRVDHRIKEVAAIGKMFDNLDRDRDGMMDQADFNEFVKFVELSLNDKERYQLWRLVDTDRSGEIDFQEFFSWYKRPTIDHVTVQLQRALRLTMLLEYAKGAMVYAVDKGNLRAKDSLRKLFDCVDQVGTGSISNEDLMALVQNLRIEADAYDVALALKQMSKSGESTIDLKSWTAWWCANPSSTASGVLRSKLKLAAFTSRASGPLLLAVGTVDDGAGMAEAYLNELLQAAFAQKKELRGLSLGVFGEKSKFRLWCSHLIQNPLTDRLLLVGIFGNVALMAAQTPGEASTVGLAVVNFGLMIVFTAEMCMRIVANGLLFGETAYLNSAWDIFDLLIISAVWALYAVSLIVHVNRNVGFGLAMLRSFRALRFFSHIRNILTSIIAGRFMIGSVLVLLVFLFMLIYVIGFQMFHGVMTTTCHTNQSHCDGCGQITECPTALECSNVFPGGHVCYSLSSLSESAQNTTRATGSRFGFDSFGTSVLTLASITTFDGWSDISIHMRGNSVKMRHWAWPAFASATVGIGLFTVNLFVAGLAYSFIKVRKTSRNLDSQGAMKKSFVERVLNDKAQSGSNEERSKHLLQLFHPEASLTARRWMHSRWFNNALLLTVLINVGFMAADHHNPSEQTVLVFDIAEATFTLIYTFELSVKLQAMGFLQYFAVILNRLDFVVVMASLFSYWLMLFQGDDSSNAKGSAVLRLLRVTKVVRAARVAKVVFRSAAVREMTAKAFAGLDTIFSLLAFIFFILTLAAIAGRELFHTCSEGAESSISHEPNFKSFWQSFLITWQVMTLDSWAALMVAHMDCAGNIAAVYFVFIAGTCAFVLGNIFVAIFMENFEIQDEEKRDLQVGIYMQTIAQTNLGDGNSKAWVNGIQKGIQGIESMLTETNTISILRRRTLDEFLRGAKLTTQAGKYVGRRSMRMKPIAKHATRCSQWWTGCRQRHRRARTSQHGSSALANDWQQQMKLASSQSQQSGYWQSCMTRQFWSGVARSQIFSNVMLVATFGSLADTVLSSESSDMSTRQHTVYLAVKIFVSVAFVLECLVKQCAFRLLGEEDSNVWPSPTTSWELFMAVVHISAGLRFAYAEALLPLRVVRVLYMVKRLRLMVEAFIRSLSAVWTALVLMAASFLAFGIVGMNLYSGVLWHCAENLELDRRECEAAGKSWENRPVNFDNIISSSIAMFSVWSMQGWTTLWYWAMDATYVDEAPAKDYGTVTAFCFFASFIMWNSLMLTNLFTSMLCGVFAQSSGSILMTSEQRNWQFMSMFLVESLRLDVVPPPDAKRWFGLASVGFKAVHSKVFKAVIDLTIVGSVVSMVGQQSLLDVDPTGLGRVLLLLDEFALLVFTCEAFFTLGGLGAEIYFRDFRTEAIVCGTMWVTTASLGVYVHFGIQLAPELQVITFTRALRLISVVKQVHAIKKIHFLVKVAWPQVINLSCIMLVVFVIFAAYATMLCGDLPHTPPITEFDNFDTVRSSFRVLFQLCTGMSMVGINYECAEYRGTAVLAFFMAFFFFANMLLVNLFIALLLDNFDLMGSEDMAVSDTDVTLFKRRWLRYAGTENGEKRTSNHTIHDSISLAQVQSFLRQPGMGTFSVMSQADPFYFNRVLFELHPADGTPGDYTWQDVIDSHSGSKDIRIFFFDLLLALCHIRFSSSCLTLANEATKSALLVKQHRAHAARIIQVGARAFLTRRSVNIYGDRAAPGFIWVSASSTGENPKPTARLVKGEDYAEGPNGRCTVCTLPRPWCTCEEKLNEQQKKEEARQLLEQAVASRDREAVAMLKSSDVADGNSWDLEHNIDENAFQEITSNAKHTWNCAVNVAMFLTLRSLINVDRITPEHVVSDAFDQLQSVVDKRQSKRRALATASARNESGDGDLDQDDQGNRVSRRPVWSLDSHAAAESIMHELRKLTDIDYEDGLAAFRMHDDYESACVSPNAFGSALGFLGLQLFPAQRRVLEGILDKEEDGTIDYEEFVEEVLHHDGLDTLAAKLAAQVDINLSTSTKKFKKLPGMGRRKKRSKKQAEQDVTVFSNPLDPEDAGSNAAVNIFEVDTNPVVKFVNPMNAGAFDDDDSYHSPQEPTRDSDSSADGGSPNHAAVTFDPDYDRNMLDPPDTTELDEQHMVSVESRPSVYRYKVVNIGTLRSALQEDSPELPGFLRVGEVVIADERHLLAESVGVRISGKQFGVTYAYTDVVAPDGSILLEYLHDDGVAFAFRARQKVYLTKHAEYSETRAAKSKIYSQNNHCGKLRPGEEVEVHSFQAAGTITRLKLHDNRGWVTLVSERGQQLMEPVRPLDMLRLHLHSLTVRQLRREAVKTYRVDPATVAQASSEANTVDPKDALIELCVANWKVSARGTDLLATVLHNADGLFEELSVGDLAKVHAPADYTMESLHGMLGRVASIKENQSGTTIVEFLIDGERATRSIIASKVRKQADEAIATSLFDAVEADDTETLDRLVASTTVPSDAVRADHTPIPVGHARVAQATNHEGHTLYEVATAKGKKRCAEYLACRLMFQAVLDDDVEALKHLLRGAGSIDAICPHDAFPRNPEAGEPPLSKPLSPKESKGGKKRSKKQAEQDVTVFSNPLDPEDAGSSAAVNSFEVDAVSSFEVDTNPVVKFVNPMTAGAFEDDDSYHSPQEPTRDSDSSAADGTHTYPRNPEAGEPLIECARREWERNGAPTIAESSVQLRGRCWFVLAERWEDRFGLAYTPQPASTAGLGDAMAVGTQSLVTFSRMRRKMEQAKDVRASKTEVEATLHWKERKAFMTRKTQIS